MVFDRMIALAEFEMATQQPHLLDRIRTRRGATCLCVLAQSGEALG
jgi:hypothetical protein